MTNDLRILIVSEHASAQFGGEAALPLHYFRVLRSRGIRVWLITHSRTRAELERLYPGDKNILYVEDTALHKLMWKIGRRIPAQIAYFTTGFVSRLAAQLSQRSLVRRLVAEERIQVIHQPMPVSPREPSLIYGFDVPVIIGPMNGGMEYPPSFAKHRGGVERLLLRLARWNASFLNKMMPGKREAALLLVANRRTQEALPRGVGSQVIELVENGVDRSLWKDEAVGSLEHDRDVTTFVFLGRLINWKAVDILLEAFDRASKKARLRLQIVGDGNERSALEALAARLQILSHANSASGCVEFLGWLPQKECATQLQAADCLVLPSLLECGGAVVLEAMCMGKPVIATAWGGPKDYIDDMCGILIEPVDRDSMIRGFADAMIRLAESAPLRSELGMNGRQKVAREYDWEVKVDRILELYEQVYNNARRHAN